MFEELKDLPIAERVVCDVCIIGSGPAGISVASKFLGTEVRAVIVESGGSSVESRYQTLNSGVNSGPRFLDVQNSRLRVYGGAGKLWAGVCSPFLADEFERKPYVELSGWPLSKADLNEFYAQAADSLGISYNGFYESDMVGKTFKELAFAEFERPNSFLAKRVYQTSSPENRDLSEKLKSKFAKARNIRVLLHSTVTRLKQSAGNAITDVVIQDLQGREVSMHARYYVLACGALENPRILLASELDFGVGNQQRLLGRCFMSHPGVSNVASVFKSSKGICIVENAVTKNRRVQFGLSSSQRERHGVLCAGLNIVNAPDLSSFSTLYSGKIFSDFRNLIRNFSVQDIYEKRICRKEGRFASSALNLNIALEQEPRQSNIVRLDASKDALGMRRIDVYWDNLGPLEKKTVETSVKVLAQEVGGSGFGRLRISSSLVEGDAFAFHDPINHHIGTTRMANSVDHGVVDSNCQVFGISNLFIAGSSVFPTSSVVNPTFTIVALSLRLGDHLKKLLKVGNRG
jgi:choline dehydrogenase-like flavoprotein